MSVQLIHIYHNEVANLRLVAPNISESGLRPPFQKLLEAYALRRKLTLVAELSRKTKTGHTIRPDGTLKDQFSDWGYWESKDEQDDLDQEIASKFAKGYPSNNILFEDSKTAVLFQAGVEVGRVEMSNAEALDQLLTRWVSYEAAEVKQFREALENFTRDVPGLVAALRLEIDSQAQSNGPFRQQAQQFLELCQKTINPAVQMADVREMIIQHILTQDIFTTIFDNADYHQDNNIAQTLGLLVQTFYSKATKKNIEAKMRPYYQVINGRAHQIADHHEKQKFLKVVYESFYKVYNPKAADRLGIVYTPNEIVHFMIEAADSLCFKYFGKGLGSKGIDILDPATGTGTFITELIDYLPPQQLKYKYQEEIFANEVSILPYYIANLNIEYTYQQKMGEFVSFENICFVDTLDNMGFEFEGKQYGIFSADAENEKRIKRQNERKISVIIGNPPYNANQLNENENNKNREYAHIDARIKDSYIKNSTAQKTKVYDMYARFYRWASDRLGDEGIIAFVSNRSFIDSRTYDGFRKTVRNEFTHLYIVDLNGDVRKNPKLSGPKNNVFGIQTGVAIFFLVKQKQAHKLPAQIFYIGRPELETAEDKLTFLASNSLEKIPFQFIQPDKNHNWINLVENDWQTLLPVAQKDVKQSKNGAEEAIFKLFSLGVATNRDEWVTDLSKKSLTQKIKFFIKIYNQQAKLPKSQDDSTLDYSIKWSATLKNRLSKKLSLQFKLNLIVQTSYRPFVKLYFYTEKELSDRLTSNHTDIFGPMLTNPTPVIVFSVGSRMNFTVLASKFIPNLALFSLDPAQCLPLHRYDSEGNRVDNITDWALKQFQDNYQDQSINKEAIFHYVYAVLHHPAYRQKYEINLKREFPRIPFYANFWQWVEWGKQLMDLHINYEEVAPYPLGREEKDPAEVRLAYKAKLKADRAAGMIELDTLTTLTGIPAGAWEYKLGNRSALEWVLDRYKERTPSDPTIAEKFNSYRFADYKEQVIELLGRVTAVSVQTLAIIEQMPKE